MMNEILSVKDLHTSFFTSMGEVKAVDGVGFDVHKGEILLANRFQLVEPADTLYYMYNIVTQFHLQNPALYLHFFAEEEKKLISLLKTHKLDPNIV